MSIGLATNQPNKLGNKKIDILDWGREGGGGLQRGVVCCPGVIKAEDSATD